MSDNSDKSYNIGPSEVLHDDNHRVDKPEAIIRRVVEKNIRSFLMKKQARLFIIWLNSPVM